MKNLFISNLDKKDVNHFTSDIGLFLRKICDKPLKKLCNIFTKANIIKGKNNKPQKDSEYFKNMSHKKIPLEKYNLKKGKNNIILERYPKLKKDESYIFVCNHTCPEDIETVLNVIDRNAYLVLGSTESLKYNKEIYLSWLNGMIPFDILDTEQRKKLPEKMERVLKTNSILIFPEGSHNYSPNNLVNKLFDGPVNLSLKTGKKIVVLTLVRDKENNISYIDASNPVNVSKVYNYIKEKNPAKDEKYLVNSTTRYIRDKMATAVYNIIERHFDTVKRNDYMDIEKHFREKNINDAFKNLKWNHDVFDAEYLVKKTKEDKEYEEVINTLSSLRLNIKTLKKAKLDSREFILKQNDLNNKDVAQNMRNYWLNSNKKEKVKTLIKK